MMGVFIPVDERVHRPPLGWVIQENGCWDWVGALRHGYGRVHDRGRSVPAHRVSYERAKGPIPTGLTIDHLCRNRACGNPDHMETVTNVENVMRGVSAPAQNARKTHCKHGHPFTPANTGFFGRGYRRCWTCHRAYKLKQPHGWKRWKMRKKLKFQGVPNEETP